MANSGRLSFLVHLIIFLVQGGTLIYDLTYIHLPIHSTYGGRFKFLTFIDAVLQVLYFGFCVFYDLVEYNHVGHGGPASRRSGLQKFKDVFFASVMFPMGTLVATTFWGIYAVDRQLIFPKHLDAIIPPWLNHNLHTSVLVFVLLDMWVTYHHYPSVKLGLSCTVGFALLYQCWLLWIYHHAGFWVYPVLEALDLQGRILFFGGLWVSLICIYLLGQALNNTIWGKSGTTASVKVKSKRR